MAAQARVGGVVPTCCAHLGACPKVLSQITLSAKWPSKTEVVWACSVQKPESTRYQALCDLAGGPSASWGSSLVGEHLRVPHKQVCSTVSTASSKETHTTVESTGQR